LFCVKKKKMNRFVNDEEIFMDFIYNDFETVKKRILKGYNINEKHWIGNQIYTFVSFVCQAQCYSLLFYMMDQIQMDQEEDEFNPLFILFHQYLFQHQLFKIFLKRGMTIPLQLKYCEQFYPYFMYSFFI